MSDVVTFSFIRRMNRKEILENRDNINNYLKIKILRYGNSKKAKNEISGVIDFLISKNIDLGSYLSKEVREWLMKNLFLKN